MRRLVQQLTENMLALIMGCVMLVAIAPALCIIGLLLASTRRLTGYPPPPPPHDDIL